MTVRSFGVGEALEHPLQRLVDDAVGVALPYVDITAAPYSAVSGSDATTAINTALAAAKHVVIPSGLSFNFTQLTIANDDVTLEIMGGATLSAQDETVAMITVSGDRCRIIGTGRILSPAVWDGTNNLSSASPAVVKVSGDDFFGQGITIENVPKVGFFFTNCDSPRLDGVRINGNFPYASYTGVNTGHAGVLYDYPSTANIHAALVMAGACFIRSCVQGVLTANFDAASYLTGLTITGNHFNQCWDHAVYTDLGKGHAIVGNTFLNCNAPIVTSGQSAVVVGNTGYATETVQSNGRQGIVVRDPIGAIIANNTLYGLGPSILCDAVSGTVVSDNIVAFNTITSTGVGVANQAIRVGLNAETCKNNSVVGNTLNVGHVGTFDGAIWLTMKAGFIGYGNKVLNNTVKVTNVCNPLYIAEQTNATVRGNTFESTATAGGATTTAMALVINCTELSIDDNDFIWREGGTNITVRGVQDDAAGANNRLVGNRFLFTAAGLTASDPIGFVTADFHKADNQISTTSAMGGTFTWTSGQPSIQVTNANVVSGSRIFITATDANGGAILVDEKPYITTTAGSFTFQSFDAGNAAVTGNFAYRID
jgi:hypothetical protein